MPKATPNKFANIAMGARANNNPSNTSFITISSKLRYSKEVVY